MSQKVCVITGGGSGMGLAAAEFLPKDRKVIITGRSEQKLEAAVQHLKEKGVDALYKTCDVSNRAQVQALADFAQQYGEVVTVLHCAGVSPQMAAPEKILRINALGTVYVNQVFSAIMPKGGVIVDVSSNSAYMVPALLAHKKSFELAISNESKFLSRYLSLCKRIRDPYQSSGLAYAVSKRFVIWFAERSAFEYGARGIRVVSLSPGLVATDMGNLEKTNGSELLDTAAEKRMGTAQELGFAIASVADERNGYLAGVDILCDGGSVHGKNWKGCF